jgi:hypothetical protein
MTMGINFLGTYNHYLPFFQYFFTKGFFYIFNLSIFEQNVLYFFKKCLKNEKLILIFDKKVMVWGISFRRNTIERLLIFVTPQKAH